MKPDKPPPPGRDRDILRARNTRQFKKSNETDSSMPVSLSESEVSGDGTEPSGSSSSTAVDDAATSTSSSTTESSSSGEMDKGAEMKMYLEKLRELVPYVPRSGKISRVKLIHSAIDYITDLQESLEARARRKLRDKNDQSSRPPLAALSQAHVETNNRMKPLAENSTNRQPTPLEINTRHPSSIASVSSASSPSEGVASNITSSTPSGSQSTFDYPTSSSSPLMPGAPGPPSSPQQPS